MGARRGDLRLGPRARQVRQDGKLKGALAALREKTGECEDMSSLVHRHLPGGGRSGPDGLGAWPLLSRVLPAGRQGRRVLVSLPGGGEPGVRLHSPRLGRSCRRATTSEDAQQETEGAAAISGRVSQGHAGESRRRPTVRWVRETVN